MAGSDTEMLKICLSPPLPPLLLFPLNVIRELEVQSLPQTSSILTGFEENRRMQPLFSPLFILR